jgi:hypothetical protein
VPDEYGHELQREVGLHFQRGTPLERLSTGWSHPVDKKSLQIQKLEHILAARIEWIRAEYALAA